MTHITQSGRSLRYGALAVIAVGGLLRAMTAAPGRTAPAAPSGPLPTTTTQAPTHKEMATLAAGCFWSMEAIFKQLKGVEKVEPGYAGGKVAKPNYEQVESGTTGHAEAIQITYDPKQISYADLLEVLLTSRNPTTLNQQGPDAGPQYRSVIFYHNEEQKKVAQEAIRKITAAHVWKQPVVTEVTPFKNFYRAEDYHLDYYRLHPDEAYCKYVIAPEIAEFRARFKAKLKS